MRYKPSLLPLHKAWGRRPSCSHDALFAAKICPLLDGIGQSFGFFGVEYSPFFRHLVGL